MDERIIVVTGNEPMPVFFKDEAWLSRSIIVGAGSVSNHMLGSRLGELILAEMKARDIEDDYFGETPCCDEDGFPSINPDCETDHGERTNHKLKDQPFYMRGAKGKMRRY